MAGATLGPTALAMYTDSLRKTQDKDTQSTLQNAAEITQIKRLILTDLLFIYMIHIQDGPKMAPFFVCLTTSPTIN